MSDPGSEGSLQGNQAEAQLEAGLGDGDGIPEGRLRRLTISRRSELLMDALNKTTGSSLLKSMARRKSTLVGDEVQDELEASEVARRSSLLGGKLHRSQKMLQQKAKLVGKVALMAKAYQQDSAERMRVKRIQERWETVRKICKAFLAVKNMLGSAPKDSVAAFSDYERLRKCLVDAPESRTYRDVGFVAEELKHVKVFREFGISLKERILLAQHACLISVPANKVIFRQGEPGDFYYVVLFGTVAVQVRDPESDAAALQKRVRSFMKRQPARPSVALLYRQSRRLSRKRKSSAGLGGAAAQAEKRGSNAPRLGRKLSQKDQIGRDQIGRRSGAAPRRRASSLLAELEVADTIVRYTTGEGFGGLALRTDPPGIRKAAVVAESACELLRIQASDYRAIIRRHEEDRINGPRRFLSSVPALSDLNDEELTQLAWNATARRYAQGSYVVRQGQLVDENEFFTVLRIGRCNVFKHVRKDGSEIPLAELCAYSALAASSDSNGEDDREGDSTSEASDSSSRSKAGPEASQSDWYLYQFANKSAGDVLAHQALLGENASRHHSISIVAETCVEVVSIPKNSLAFALRRGDKLARLAGRLPVYPVRARLRELVRQDRVWCKFRGRFVRKTLTSTARGQRILEEAADVRRERERLARAEAVEVQRALEAQRDEARRKQDLLRRQESVKTAGEGFGAPERPCLVSLGEPH